MERDDGMDICSDANVSTAVHHPSVTLIDNSRRLRNLQHKQKKKTATKCWNVLCVLDSSSSACPCALCTVWSFRTIILHQMECDLSGSPLLPHTPPRILCLEVMKSWVPAVDLTAPGD